MIASSADVLPALQTMCGTPSYLAPEVVKQVNHEGYDSSVDSWSVGVIVFSMLTNSSPFIEDETQRDIRTRIVERTIDWPQLQNRGLSAEGKFELASKYIVSNILYSSHSLHSITFAGGPPVPHDLDRGSGPSLAPVLHSPR